MYNLIVVVDRYRNYQPRRYTRQPQKKNHKGLFVVLCVAFLLVGGRSVLNKVQATGGALSSSASTAPKLKPLIKAEPIATSTWNDISQKVGVIIDQNPGLDISVAVIDVSTNTKANYGIQDNFAGASTTKVLTAITYLHEAEAGRESMTKTINGKSIRTHLKQMVNQSNNDSWATLNKELTYAKIENYARSLGITSYTYKDNTITAGDEALLLQKLFKGELINETNQKLLLSFMQNTNNEDMIPKVIPSGATIYHKYGQLEDRLHDAAIVDYNNRPLVVVVYTKGGANDGSNYKIRTSLVKQLAQSVIETVYTL